VGNPWSCSGSARRIAHSDGWWKSLDFHCRLSANNSISHHSSSSSSSSSGDGGGGSRPHPLLRLAAALLVAVDLANVQDAVRALTQAIHTGSPPLARVLRHGPL
jgi:hypothetical protein